MRKKYSRIIGAVMLLIAIIFLCFAFSHPEMCFPWSNIITYLIVMVVMFIAPFDKRK